MKVTLLIAVVLASVVLTDSWRSWSSWRRRRRRSRSLDKKGVNFQEKEEALQDFAAKLEEVVHDAESKAALDLMTEFQEVEGSNDALNGRTFQKKVATLQEAAAKWEKIQETAAKWEKKVNEVEEDAALGLVEEELEELEKELEEVDGDPDE